MDAAPTAPTDRLEAAFLDLRPELLARARAIDPSGDAEDVLHEVWIRLRGVREPVINPRGYLMRMIYTAVVDRRRSLRRAAARDGGWAAEQRLDGEPGSAPAEAERNLIARQTLERVDACLRDLGEPTNSIFRRYRFGGEPQRQIAADLGFALSTVEKHLQKAYVALHRLRGDQA